MSKRRSRCLTSIELPISIRVESYDLYGIQLYESGPSSGTLSVNYMDRTAASLLLCVGVCGLVEERGGEGKAPHKREGGLCMHTSS